MKQISTISNARVLKTAGLLAGFLLSAGAAPVLAGNAGFYVYVRNSSGTAVASAQVAALHFANNGPDASLSTYAFTNTNGVAFFTLQDNYEYDVFATSQGFLPSIRDQFNDPYHLHLVPPFSVSAGTITLSSFTAANLGEIDITVQNYPSNNNLVFGSVKPSAGAYTEPVAFGVSKIVSGTNDTVKIFNVPYSPANTYNAEAFDPSTNKAISKPVVSDLNGSNQRISVTVDFSNSMAPVTVSNEAQQAGNAGNFSVDGVVTDTATPNWTALVPWVGINFYGQYATGFSTQTDYRWVNADRDGRFQLYGLMRGVTYYAQVYWGCSWDQGQCYEGNNSTAGTSGIFGAAPALNDFLYTGAPIIKRIQLRAAAASNGQIKVVVKDTEGNRIPQAWANVWPDGNQYQIGAQCLSRPGMGNAGEQTNAAGEVTLDGLPSGNYEVQVWTPFTKQGGTRYTGSPDGKSCWEQQPQTCGCSASNKDYRVTIDTNAGPNYVSVFNAIGNPIYPGVSSVTIQVQLSTSNTGMLKGTLYFPWGGINLSLNPISIVLQPNCRENEECKGGGFKYFNAPSTGPVINYAIPISTGKSYWMNITSNYWGIIREGGGQNQVDMSTGVNVVNLDLKFAPAGRLVGNLYKPDGSIFQPKQGEGVWINANGNNSWGGTQVNNDGSFILGGLLPGTYKINLNGWGKFTYASPTPAPTASISANQDTYQNVTMLNGTPVRVKATMSSLPPMPVYDCSGTSSGDCPPEFWKARAYPQGTIFDSEKIAALMFGDNSSADFRYFPDPLKTWCGNLPAAGFCPERLPSPGVYDFYLFRAGDMNTDLAREMGVLSWPYFAVVSSTRNIVLDPNDPRTKGNYTPFYWQGSTVSVLPVDLTPTASMASISTVAVHGFVIGQNIIRKQDFVALGGNFDNFMKYIPALALYDSNNALKGAAMVIPHPACFKDPLNIDGVIHSFDAWVEQSVAQNNFDLMMRVFQSCPGGWQFEIHGMSTGTYTAVLTTPNYPPYQTSVTLDGSISMVTMPVINLDAAGQGATLQGVITSTPTSNWVAIATASVSIAGEAYKERTVTTDGAGFYKLEGLPAGAYRIKVAAAGYANAYARQDVGSSGTYEANFRLRAAGSSITGTVYSQKVPFVKVQPGAKILAYKQNDPSDSSEPALYKTMTSSTGFYRLDGLEDGKSYKVSVKYPGKYVVSQDTATPAGGGTVSGIDFALLPKPPDIEIFGRPVPPNYEFYVLNPNDFKDGHVWIGSVPFDMGTAQNMDSYFTQLSTTQLLLRIPLDLAHVPDPNGDYTLHGEAETISGKIVTKEIVFGAKRRGNSVQNIRDALLGDDSEDEQGRKANQAYLDASGENASAVTLPRGSLGLMSETAIPTCRFSNMDVNAATVAALVQNISTSAFASGIYQITFSSIGYVPGGNGLDLTLAYDKTNTSLADLSLYHYNDTEKKWEEVPGQKTIDPVKGTISVRRIKSVSSVLGLKSGHPLMLRWTGASYAASSQYRAAGLIPDDSGSFAIMRPSLTGSVYSGTTIKIYNFPNPFNLSAKTPTLVHKQGGQIDLTTYGTIIKIEVPPGVSGRGVIRIYTLNGELVRELDVDLTASTYYYREWDGRNKSGSKVANGVYYGILSIPGVKAKDATFKMAVIK
ncbi:MAG: carboxypeptidase regulatory-like domain-containing protein [Elusimicrobia bacterium]|nr:carboxypeptidase regulatory-like domain-containing protein [Elusimicrobiota bacterium]